MMKMHILVATAIALAGCSGEGIGSMDKAKQRLACATHGGVYEYKSIFHKASCRSGAQIDGWYNLELSEEYMPGGVE